MSSTTTDDDGGIPTVVQRALGMQNLTTHQNCDDGASNTNYNIICGLEGFLLPRYLALRSGSTVQQYSNSCSYDMLMRAKNEELQHRISYKQQKVDTSKSNSKRPRKRKRKSDHHHGISCDNNTSGNGTAVRSGYGNDIDMQQSTESDAPTKSKRRKRRRRRKSSHNQLNNATSINKGDWLHYQMMARIIVAPFTSSLITTMNKCKQLEKQNQKSSHYMLVNDDAEQHTTPNINQVMPSSTTSNTAAEKLTDSVSLAVKNIYEKKSTTNSTHSKSNNNNLLLTLSSPQESLATIVDGAVCTLVRRTHRHRSTKSSKIFKSSRNNSVGKKQQQIVYRRRQRPKSKKGDTSMATPSSSTMNNNTINNNNNWLLEQNLLSTGYTLGSGETYSSSHNNNNNTNQNNQLLRGCPNMAPGIHCLHLHHMPDHHN